MSHTEEQFTHAIALCKEVFRKKLQDYGASWRILRPSSVTDQLYIKASRIRHVEENGEAKVQDEDSASSFIALINYSIIGLIQLEKGASYSEDMSVEEAMALYEKYAQSAQDLMFNKNTDYGEAWRSMRISSYTDLILTKLNRIKQIEDNEGQTVASEGIDANYYDILNYSVFAIIRLVIEKQ